jgi:hypothetical protein
MLCEGMVREKVARYDAKLRRQSCNRVRYTEEITPDGREHVEAHVDMAAAKEYIAAGNGWRKLLPYCHMNEGQRIRAALAKDKLEMRLDSKHGQTTLKVVA